MKCALIGASGFLGRHCIPFLSNNFDSVVATYTTARPTSLYLNVTHKKLVISPISSVSLSELGNPDVVFFLPWGFLQDFSSPQHIEQELPKYLRFLTSLITQGLPYLVVAGTCLEYGLQEGCLDPDSPLYPLIPYAQAKCILHSSLRRLQQTYSFTLNWSRFFYIYGLDQNPRSLYPSLMQSINQNNSIFNLSEGNQVRDFIHVDSAAMLFSSIPFLYSCSTTINISSGSPISVKDQVHQWCKQSKSNIRLNLGFYQIPFYEPFRFWGKPPFLLNA